MSAVFILKDMGLVTACYLIGAIPFCNIIAKIVSGKDLTKIGDKNPGSWNLVFNVSKIWGILGIILDVGKGWASYFVVLNFIELPYFSILGASHNQVIAILAGVSAVAGHIYTPYLKFKGGKGIATFLGFSLSVTPWTLPFIALGILPVLFWIKNMLWGITAGIIVSGIFLYFYMNSAVYLVMALLLVIVMIPRQLNRTISFSENLRFRKEKKLSDLFTPKIR